MTIETKDLTRFTELKLKGSVLEALLEGHIITVAGEDYRYANKDDHLYEDDERIYVATESGFFQRYHSYKAGEASPSSFRWIRITDNLAYFSKLYESMTEDEVLTALGNRVLTSINTEGTRTRRLNAARENHANRPRTR